MLSLKGKYNNISVKASHMRERERVGERERGADKQRPTERERVQRDS